MYIQRRHTTDATRCCTVVVVAKVKRSNNNQTPMQNANEFFSLAKAKKNVRKCTIVAKIWNCKISLISVHIYKYIILCDIHRRRVENESRRGKKNSCMFMLANRKSSWNAWWATAHKKKQHADTRQSNNSEHATLLLTFAFQRTDSLRYYSSSLLFFSQPFAFGWGATRTCWIFSRVFISVWWFFSSTFFASPCVEHKTIVK